MIYLDNGATSFHKPREVTEAVRKAMFTCANPGRGGYREAMYAAEVVYRCREKAGKFFDCPPEQVVFTHNCTHGLNIAIRSLMKPGANVLITGFEHNAVTRPLYALGANVIVAGRKLFDWNDTLEKWENALKRGADVAVFTQCSNVFGYILPVEKMAYLCRKYRVPFVIDAAQGAGVLPLSLKKLGANFIAMPGHKGLLGPQGPGILLCGCDPKALLYGGTGSNSVSYEMPDFLPDKLEAGTLNVPGIAGLEAGLSYISKIGISRIFQKEQHQAAACAKDMEKMGFSVFRGPHQSGTFSFVPKMDCEDFAELAAEKGICLRAGLHCAPLAHESAGTLARGTVRVSFGHDASDIQRESLCKAAEEIKKIS